jgi:hypothetical protein
VNDVAKTSRSSTLPAMAVDWSSKAFRVIGCTGDVANLGRRSRRSARRRSSGAEQLSCKQQVVGSNPTAGSLILQIRRGCVARGYATSFGDAFVAQLAQRRERPRHASRPGRGEHLAREEGGDLLAGGGGFDVGNGGKGHDVCKGVESETSCGNASSPASATGLVGASVSFVGLEIANRPPSGRPGSVPPSHGPRPEPFQEPVVEHDEPVGVELDVGGERPG